MEPMMVPVVMMLLLQIDNIYFVMKLTSAQLRK